MPSSFRCSFNSIEGRSSRLERKELDAVRIAGPGVGDPLECAAWTILARALLNADEAVTKG